MEIDHCWLYKISESSPGVNDDTFHLAGLGGGNAYNDSQCQIHDNYVTAGYGTERPFLGKVLGGNASGTMASNYVTAAVAPDGKFGGAYLPTTSTITVNMTEFSGPVSAKWVDPSTGHSTVVSGSPFASNGTQTIGR